MCQRSTDDGTVAVRLLRLGDQQGGVFCHHWTKRMWKNDDTENDQSVDSTIRWDHLHEW